MKTIYKYKLALTDSQVIKAPRDFTALSVGLQAGEICLWAEVETESPRVPRRVWIQGTGNPFAESMTDWSCLAGFVGTVQIGLFVWHIYSEIG